MVGVFYSWGDADKASNRCGSFMVIRRRLLFPVASFRMSLSFNYLAEIVFLLQCFEFVMSCFIKMPPFSIMLRVHIFLFLDAHTRHVMHIVQIVRDICSR